MGIAPIWTVGPLPPPLPLQEAMATITIGQERSTPLLGGIFAYLLLPQVRVHLRDSRSAVQMLGHIGGLARAGLFAIVVTILLSRLADTQFFVKVTVNDVWGAIAVGFVASVSGTNLINRLGHLHGDREVQDERSDQEHFAAGTKSSSSS